jgi:hypothetical protein
VRKARSTALWIAIAVGFGLMLYTCALPGDLPAAVDTSDGLAGTYSVNGVNPNGSELAGTAVFTATDDPDVFDFELIVTGSIQTGRAVRSGDLVEVTWETVSSAADQTLTGTADYTVGADGTLTGTWTVNDPDGSGGSDDNGQSQGTIELFPEP